MPSPFPGMDPYLERPGLWPDVHHELISQIRRALHPQLRPKYVASVELRVYISNDDDNGRKVMVPDVRVDKSNYPKNGPSRSASTSALVVDEPTFITLLNEEIEEAYLAIRETKSDALVAIIEVLSPTNKIAGSAGRNSFMAKRSEILNSEVHWLEIDLLRAGKPTALNAELRQSDYRIIVSHARNHLRARYWPLSIRQQLPIIGVPLRAKDPDVPLDLGSVLHSAYDETGWDLKIDYTQPPDPPLNADDAKWANKLLRTGGLR